MTTAGAGDYTEPVTVEVTGSPGTSGGISSYLVVVIVIAAVILVVAMVAALVGTCLVYKKLRNTKSSSTLPDPAVASEPQQQQNEAYAVATEVFLDEVKLSPNAAYAKETAEDRYVAKMEVN